VDSEAYRQNWERLMHVDRQRMAFSNFYALIVGGLLGVLAVREWDCGLGVYIFGFLFLLSLFGFLLNWRINKHVDAYEGMLEKIARKMQIRQFYTRGADPKAWVTLRRLYKCLPLFGTLAFFALLAKDLCSIITN